VTKPRPRLLHEIVKEVEGGVSEFGRLEIENAYLRKTLVKVVIPLETLHWLGNSWKHPVLRRRWVRMVSPGLRAEIGEAVRSVREAIRDDA